MPEVSEHSDFMKTVQEIRSAEEEYDHLISEAKQKADAILRKAREQVLKERRKAHDAATAHKNERLKSGSDGIEREVDKILEKAKSEADGIRKKKSDQKFTHSLVKELLN